MHIIPFGDFSFLHVKMQNWFFALLRTKQDARAEVANSSSRFAGSQLGRAGLWPPCGLMDSVLSQCLIGEVDQEPRSVLPGPWTQGRSGNPTERRAGLREELRPPGTQLSRSLL